jgi:hypothetical protein
MVRTIQYEDPNKNGIGKKGLRELKGDENGPFVVPKNESGVAQSAGTATDPVYTQHVDSNGRVEGEVGYVGPIMQSTNKTSGTVVSGSTDPTVTFEASATANTELTLATIPAITQAARKHLLIVENMSAVTTMTVNVKPVAETLNGGDKDSTLTQLSIPVSSVRSVIIEGACVVDTKFTVSNDVQITDAAEGNRKVTMRLIEL